MKKCIALLLLVSIALAEVPPSHEEGTRQRTEGQKQTASPEYLSNLQERIETLLAICGAENGQMPTQNTVVRDADGVEINCAEEAKHLQAEFLAAQQPGMAQGGCTQKSEPDSTCVKELSCNLARTAANGVPPFGWIARDLARWFGPKSLSMPGGCLDRKKGDCLTEVVAGVLKDLWGNVEAVWEIAKFAARKTRDFAVGTWNYFFGAEDDSSDAMLAAANQPPGFLEKFKRDPLDAIADVGKVLYDGIVGFIRESFMCRRWSGVPHLSQCLEPADSWACADCDQKMNAICGVAGMLGTEVALFILTAGAVTSESIIAKLGASALGQMAKTVASKLPTVARIGAVTAQLVNKVGATLEKLAALGKAGTQFVVKNSPTTLRIAGRVITSPVRAYGALMDRAYKLARGINKNVTRALFGRYTEGTMVLDANMAIVRGQMRSGAALQGLDDQRALFLKAWDELGLELKVTERSGLEAVSTAEKLKQIRMIAKRSDPDYVALHKRLEEVNLGGSKGAADRQIVADTFFADTPRGTVATFVCSDGNVLKKLWKLAGKDALTEPVSAGFQVAIGRRTINVVGIRNPFR